MAIIPQYGLQPGPLITIEGRDQEVSNLQLQATVNVQTGVISGIVRNAEGAPVANATVQLFNQNGQPFEHETTNPAGRFTIPQIPAGSYFITASEPTYLTPLRMSVTITANRNTQVTITMQPNPNVNANAVFGIVRNSVDNSSIVGAQVNLFQTTGTTEELIGSVTSNSEGQYLFANLPNGTYYVEASKLGYFTSSSAAFTVGGRNYVPSNILLPINAAAFTGTISGIITDSQTNQPIPNAIIALYSIIDGVESIIYISTTNAGGLYLFGDLPVGTYRIKATVQVQT